MHANEITERDRPPMSADRMPPASGWAAAFDRTLPEEPFPAADVTARSATPPPCSTARTILPRAESDGKALRLVHHEHARYEPIRPLGAGGMGEVTLVYDRDIGRMVAVKRLLPEFDDATALRFVDEIRTVGQLEHPSIVPIHDVGVDDDGRYFFVMKYVEGETLASVIERLRAGDPEYHRYYTVERRIAIFLDVLRALSAAHARGVLHRDVKPGNVMVRRSGEVMVMDWGIAKAVRHGVPGPSREAAEMAIQPPSSTGSHCPTRAGALVGTPSYMSPEQASGKNDELDERSDLYSATVLFHELVTLRHYLGERSSSEEMLVAVIADEVSFRVLAGERHPSEPAPPAELLRFAAKGLEKDPADRFQSAREMIEVLESILEARTALQRRLASAKRRLRGLGRLLDARLHLALLTIALVVWRMRAAFA